MGQWQPGIDVRIITAPDFGGAGTNSYADAKHNATMALMHGM
jgi:hypothetical protein